ncbi:hypothetical protein ACEPAF_4760 [Sanghuangporus sanghuang]
MSTVPSCLLNPLPVIQPQRLDGDPSLATEILPGPPSLESISQISKRNEPRKFPVPSYLPLSDPGTTYTSLAGGMAAMALDDNGSRRKRARLDKGISHRSQRTSSRHLAGNSALGDQFMMLEADITSSQRGMDDASIFNEDDRSTSHSRSTSAPLSGEAQEQSISENGPRIINGKGKEKEKENTEKVAQVRVKEEPVALQLADMPNGPMNEDYCSSCSSVGALVYCDGCPRAFHLWCLDPPMDPSDFPEGEESWFCPTCKVDRGPQPRSSHTFLSPLIQQLQNTIPTEFRLPEEIRTFFRDVATGPGGVYMDNSSVKANRIGRHGFAEERDPFRLKDNKGAPVICFRCGMSALPDEPELGHSTRARGASTVSPQSQRWKSMISCDFCPLHWHVDCLDPPMTSLPPISRKWKCPNHANSSAPKARTPRVVAPPIDIIEPRQRNNGNIEVINSEFSSRPEEKMSIDELLINGRRYRVPERIIVVDFWNKIRQPRGVKTSVSAASSPLTSLSSLEDRSDQPPALMLNDQPSSSDILRVAELLCHLQSGEANTRLPTGLSKKEAREEMRKARSGRHGANSSGLKNEIHRAHPCRPWTASKLPSKSRSRKDGMNGVGPSHPHDKVSRITLRSTSRLGGVSPEASSTHCLHDADAKQGASLVNGFRPTSIANSINGPSRAKTSTSPLKIRIPGRLLQNRSSNGTASESTSTQPPASISSLQVRPRRSLRHHASTSRTGSERSLSVDQDGRL